MGQKQGLTEKLLHGYARAVWKYRWWFFFITLGITGAAVYQITKLKLDPSLTSLLPEHYQSVKNLDRAAKVYGGVGHVVVVTRGSDYEKARKFIDDLVARLEDRPYVRYVDYQNPLEAMEEHILLYADIEDIKTIYWRLWKKIDYEKTVNDPSWLGLEEIKDPGFSIGDIIDKYKNQYSDSESEVYNKYYYYENKDVPARPHTFILKIKPDQPAMDVSYCRDVLEKIQADIDSLDPAGYGADLTNEFTGRYRKKLDDLAQLKADFSWVTMFSVVSILGLLTFYFRNFWPIYFVFSGLVAGLLWTLGGAQLLYGQLNLITSFLVAILSGLGIDFGIHLIVRYKEERQAGHQAEEAFYTTIRETGAATLAAGVTTALAFFGLSFSGFRAFSEFGNIAALGIFMVFLAMLSVMACLLAISDRHSRRSFSTQNFHLRLPERIWSRPGLVLFLALALTVMGGFGLTKLGFDYDFSKIQAKGTQSHKLAKEVNDFFKRSLTPSVILPESIEEEKKILAAFEEYIERNKDNKDLRIDHVMGVTTILPENQDAKLKEIGKINWLLKSNAKYAVYLKGKNKANYYKYRKYAETGKLTAENLPFEVRKSFSGVGEYAGQRVVLVFPRADLSKGRQVIQYHEQLKNIRVEGEPVEVASDALIFAEILELIQRDGPWIMAYSLTMVFIVLMIDFRRIRKAMVVLLPLLLGMIWLSGTMGLVGIKLDFFNVIVFPIIIGIGIDSGVHIYHRYQLSRNIVTAVQYTGEAVTLSSATTFLGFLGLVFTHNEALSSMGMTALIGIAGTYLAFLLLLPALVRMRRALIDKKEARLQVENGEKEGSP